MVQRVRKHNRDPGRRYGSMSNERVAALGNILMRTVRSQFGGAASFRRDDVVRSGIFDHVAYGTQIQTISQVVRYLIDRGDLVAVSAVDLCLPNHVQHYSKEPLWHAYYDTVASILEHLKHDEVVRVADVVAHWKTDPHITAANKVSVVRISLRRLMLEGHLKTEGCSQLYDAACGRRWASSFGRHGPGRRVDQSHALG